ncbi:Indeterminate(ID)-domain 5 putative isoform 2 [Tripterygium wilfordii]|uniref:Indeterminate(ID)-domain 5 putative isoform 2 n=1 Tax=Tripterygium wilfordii TaxID=458696 RepID=A0A7J7DVA1_TRIWF|nr:protein indeterminate-domain 4, chloroplastic-like [Tripterygium wilfordii]XP_038691801.1 protein indeterminate-domain 4, chloroplastic-like [Tripterygium wilfordii]KAF5750046.1 Indeterminate(ID)-domain 5 putative isoform 2 [Tripterygium wilfordii]
MAAASSSTPPFFGMTRENNQNQLIVQQQSSTTTTTPTSSSTALSAPPPPKKRRNQPGTPYPDAEVIALSPKTLMATNRFICEVCNKGFQREQNLQLHRRGHNLPWKLRQKTTKEVKRKVYLCPEPTCVHHDPSRALGDLTGIKKHYSRKHGEKKWKCEKCSKRYAVQSDWKAHSKTCGTREYRCDCGTLFSRRDSFITHRAFCDALAQESARHPPSLTSMGSQFYGNNHMSIGLQDQTHPSNNMLRLGNAKFEHLIPPSNPSSLQTMPSSNFFMQDSNQQSFPNKPLHGLMQLPDLQTNTNTSPSSAANIFNLSFNNSDNIANASNATNNLVGSGFLNPNQFNMGEQVGSGLASIYNASVPQQHEHVTQHMSATALLQKAAQMGSTTSNSGGAGSTLLRGLGCTSSSSSGGANKSAVDRINFGSNFGNANVENQNNNSLQGLMNSFAAHGGGSIFGGFSTTLDQNSNNFCNIDEATATTANNTTKLHHDHQLGVSIGGSDKLTLDFLGVGGMVRNMASGGGINMGSLENPEIKSTHASQPFGSAKMQ